jgi:hypothetical protein
MAKIVKGLSRKEKTKVIRQISIDMIVFALDRITRSDDSSARSSDSNRPSGIA